MRLLGLCVVVVVVAVGCSSGSSAPTATAVTSSGSTTTSMPPGPGDASVLTTTTEPWGDITSGPGVATIWGESINHIRHSSVDETIDGYLVSTITESATMVMSDPRASGAERWVTEVQFSDEPDGSWIGTYESNEHVIINDNGSWVGHSRGVFSVASNLPSAGLTDEQWIVMGESHFLGHGDYEGLRMDLYNSTLNGTVGTITETDIVDHSESVEPVLSGTVAGVDVFNADTNQVALATWALERFTHAGLPSAPVTKVTFPPTAACTSGHTGIAYLSEAGGNIGVCVEASELAMNSMPLVARRAILHELAHVWAAHQTNDDIRSDFMAVRGVSEWRADLWEDSGFEHAAEVLMWGLIDEPVTPRIPNNSCTELHTAYRTLTGQDSPKRADCRNP